MWKVKYTKRFLKELSNLPNEIQVQAEKIVFEELPSSNPFDLGYLEHMTGYPHKYKIRIGKHESVLRNPLIAEVLYKSKNKMRD